MATAPTALRLSPAFEQPAEVLESTRRAGPYWPLARYASTGAAREAAGSPSSDATIVPPWFRLDFAIDGVAEVDGADEILHNPRFVDAARRVYGGECVVRPLSVYVNQMGPASFPFFAHIDVPAFRGVTRADHPVWLLQQMHASGLFEHYRIRQATAVSWFYGGPGGAFHYWPDGPGAPAVVEEPPFENVAVVADNEATYHGVETVGEADVPPPADLTNAGRLERRSDGAGWSVTQSGVELADYDDAIVRTTISWKAEVFEDEADRARLDEGSDDLAIERVVDELTADLGERGSDVSHPDDPHTDEDWMRALSANYSETAPRIG